MAISNWFCRKNTENMLVRIVHLGGHVELHDRPITAADVVHRNPKFCVTYPEIFKQPWAIVAPATTLMPGQKFYVVPISTIRKLQRRSRKYSPALLQEMETIQNAQKNGERHSKASISGKISKNGAAKPTHSCPEQFKNNGRGIIGEGGKRLASCCTCLRRAMESRARTEDKNKETGSSNSSGGCEKNLLTEKRNSKDLGGGPRRLSSFDQWQPSLESIIEDPVSV